MNEQLKNEFMQLEHEAVQAEQEQEKQQEVLYGESKGINEDGIKTAEIIAPVIGLCCDLFAPNWKIQAQEKELLTDSYAQIIDKYFPDSLGKMGVELNALLITAAIITPRLGIPRNNPPPADIAEDIEPQKEESVTDE